MAEDEKTGKSGSEPEDSKNEKDVNAAESSSADDAKKTESSTEEVPWHKDPRFKNDLGLLKAAKSLMEANELSDIDDLRDLVESGKKVYGKKVDLDRLDELVEKASTLDRYQTYWNQQEELKRRNAETPEETIARLQRERDEAIGHRQARERSEKEQREARNAVNAYDAEVKSFLTSNVNGLSDVEKEFIAWAAGVDNECNEIQITDKRAVRKVVSDSVKKYQKLKEAIADQAVKEYISGKKSVPGVPSTDGAVAVQKAEPIKGLKNLRKAFMESVTQKGG